MVFKNFVMVGTIAGNKIDLPLLLFSRKMKNFKSKQCICNFDNVEKNKQHILKDKLNNHKEKNLILVNTVDKSTDQTGNKIDNQGHLSFSKVNFSKNASCKSSSTDNKTIEILREAGTSRILYLTNNPKPFLIISQKPNKFTFHAQKVPK